MSSFPVYYIVRKKFIAKTSFVPSKDVDNGIPVSTPLTFPVTNEGKFLLALDKNNWWNPVCGHIEKNETWQETLYREAREEVGADIDGIEIFGSIVIEEIINKEKRIYPKKSQIPVTTSMIKKYYKKWVPLETKERRIVSRENAICLFMLRNDNNLLLEVFKFIFR